MVRRDAVIGLLVSIATATASAQSTVVPLPNYNGSLQITREFDEYVPGKGYHTGVDLVSDDDFVRAVDSGTVAKVQGNDGCACGSSGCPDHGLGNSIILEHRDPRGGKVYSLYGHLKDKPAFKVGDPVGFGEVVGQVGATSSGCENGVGKHLHWETKTAAVLENPSGGGVTWGYGPVPSEQRGYYAPLYRNPIRDMRAVTSRDARFNGDHPSAYLYTYPEWSPYYALSTMAFKYKGECNCLNEATWVFHAASLTDPTIRYTIWFNPETQAYTQWEVVR